MLPVAVLRRIGVGGVTSLEGMIITCTGVNFLDLLISGFACFPHPKLQNMGIHDSFGLEATHT